MSDIPITVGNGTASVATDLVSSQNYQQIKVVDGTIGSTNPWKVNADGSAQVSIVGTMPVIVTGSVLTTAGAVANQSVSGTVGASIIGAAPVNIVSQTPVSGNIDSYTAFSTALSTTNYAYVFNGNTWDRARGNSSIGTLVTPYAFPTSLVSGVTSVITSTSSVTVLTGAPGGQRNYITQILATNGSGTGTFVNIYDAGQVVYSGYAAASGGGFSASFPAPLRQASAQGALCVATPSQGSVVVAVSGFTAP